MPSDESDSAVARWLQRPYVGERFHSGGPKITNAGMLMATMFIQGVSALGWYFSRRDAPVLLWCFPVLYLVFYTGLLLAVEPEEQAKEGAPDG